MMQSSSSHIDSQQCEDQVKDAVKTGIYLGRRSYHRLSEQKLADLQHWRPDIDFQSIPTVCLTFSRMFKVNDYDLGVVYRTDEYAIIRDAEDGHREWVAKIIALCRWTYGWIIPLLFKRKILCC